MSTTTTTALSGPTSTPDLSLARLHLMRSGYLLMGVGLALKKWPLLAGAHTMPLYEGVTCASWLPCLCWRSSALRHPVRLLPLLLFESAWKVLWLGLVALPRAIDGRSGQGHQRHRVQLFLRRPHPRGHPVDLCVAHLRARER